MSIRVMIVDDSAVMRRLLTMALRPATDIEVVAMAANGREALELLDEVDPDLVTLDVEMPEMDGLATMQAIHDARPGLAVIMCSGLTEQHAVTTINALRAGAVDYITKPMASSSDEALQTVHDQLVPKIRVLSTRASRPRRLVEPRDGSTDRHDEDARDATAAPALVTADPAPVAADGSAGSVAEPTPAISGAAGGAGRPRSAPEPAVVRAAPADPDPDPARSSRRSARSTRSTERDPAAVPAPAARRPGAGPVSLRPWPATMPTIDLVAIGVSTGGPMVLERLFESLPASFPVPIVIVQHMPAVFTKILAERIDAKSELKVREAAGGEVLTAGTVWVAPGGLHLKVRKTAAGGVLVLDNGAPENSCKPSVDVLFRSVTSAFGPHALGVVLTGMGRDGTSGARALVDAGGLCIAQDEATSTVWGMPGSVAQQGLASALVGIDDVAGAVESIVARTPWTALVSQTA